jgi:hypothetical protein
LTLLAWVLAGAPVGVEAVFALPVLPLLPHALTATDNAALANRNPVLRAALMMRFLPFMAFSATLVPLALNWLFAPETPGRR